MSSRLSRRLGFFSLTVYGVGDILGAGIYALVGKVVGIAGSGAWLTFLAAAVVAGLTGLSYAELSARFPVAGGAAAFVSRAFPGRLIGTIIGVLVFGTGIVSASTVTVAFGNYLQEIFPALPPILGRIFLVGIMSFLSFWGIQESARVNTVLTSFEVGGLIAVIVAGSIGLGSQDLGAFAQKLLHEWSVAGVIGGITVAFYAYIGFEDLSNLAEECKNPARDLPRAILIALAFATVVYSLVALVLLLHVSKEAIGESKTPLLLVFEAVGWSKVPDYFAVIAIFAIANTGLVNLIMASRLMYGMSEEKLLPPLFGRIHAKRSTPWMGVLVAAVAVLLLVFTGSLKILAQTTSLLILVVFFFVHLSLLRVKKRKEPHEGMIVPWIFPVLGALSCLALVFTFPGEVFLRSAILLGLGFVVWLVQRKTPHVSS